LSFLQLFIIAPYRYQEIMKDRAYLNQVLRDGAYAADEVATQTLDWAKNAMGFCSLKDIQ
jgi:hypothetical protein